MDKGGTITNAHVIRIMRFIGLIVPVGLVFYGLLVKSNIVDSSHYSNDFIFYGITAAWIIIAALFFIYPTDKKWLAAIRLISYHLLAGLYIIFVSGFSASFVASWILLFIAAYTVFSQVGFRLSGLFFITLTIIDMALQGFERSIVIVDVLASASVVIVGMIVIAINRVQEVDSTELLRSKAQEVLQHDRILAIVNNLADAVLSTDKDGIVRVYNAASLNLLNTNSSLNGRHIDEIVTLNDQTGAPVNLLKTLKKARGVAIRDDLKFTIEDETLRLEMTYSPIRSNYTKSKKSTNQDGYIVILRDVTKAKSLEEERDEFISVVSHELRTPITIAEGTISNVQLMMARKGIAKKKLEEGITTAHDQVIFLAKMVNDLSTLSRAERGVADMPEVIDVRNLINDLYAEYAPQAERKQLHFNLDLSPRLGKVTASPLYLKELLQNFITNSLKYTKQGTITIRVIRTGDKITFDIKDTGIGISKSDQSKVFRKFYRSEDYRTRETGGTGLGLYVAAKLAIKLGTKIEMTSRLNHGSSFSITLPANEK